MMASFQKQKPVRFLSNRASRCSVHRWGTQICVPYEGFRLPARSPALRDEGRGIFEQPDKDHFFSNRIDHKNTLEPRSKTAPLGTTNGVPVESSPRHQKISGGRYLISNSQS